jgi:hypothetical protein
MYRRPRFLEVLLKIREEMAREADYDVDFFVEMVRNGMQPATDVRYSVGDLENGQRHGRSPNAEKQRKLRSKRKMSDPRG